MRQTDDGQLAPWDDPIPEEDTGSIYPVITERVRTLYAGSDDILGPEEYKQKVAAMSGPPPVASKAGNILNLTLYAALALAGFAFYHYITRHAGRIPIPLILAFLVIGGMLLFLHGRRETSKLFSTLQRTASRVAGAFVAMEGEFPVMYVARDRWNGWVFFAPQGEHQSPFCRLAARTRRFNPPLEVFRRGMLDSIARRTDEGFIQTGDPEFDSEFAVFSTDPSFARNFLDPSIKDAVVRIARLGRPSANISRNYISVEVEKDLSRPGDEAMLMQFLKDAELILDAAAG
ncbi:MAG: hypothetical protein HZA22_10990 [Nitrospirae bacterium]|nr:hypothetical protein [Nitrospirota bacterium]MBI5695228.1 hypothetical protein [Nitrospirota bacterium]